MSYVVDYLTSNFNYFKANNLISPSGFSFDKITEPEILLAIKQLDSSSSCGITGIPVKVIKHCAEVLVPILSNLFNFFLNSSSIPTEFKSAKETTLFKNGAKDSCDNYRGISVLSLIAKIFERILYNNIIKYFNSNNLFTANQHGFRTNHSCETALHSI